MRLKFLLNARRCVLKTRYFVIIAFVALFIHGCATGYKRDGFTGGYSDIQLDENVFKVSFKGNGYTSGTRAADFTLLRCAELALENGFKYFGIVSEESYTSTSSYTTPTKTRTTGRYNPITNRYTEKTKTTGGQTRNIVKPRSSNIIICFNEKPETMLTYNAGIVCDNLKEKYNIK